MSADDLDARSVPVNDSDTLSGLNGNTDDVGDKNHPDPLRKGAIYLVDVDSEGNQRPLAEGVGCEGRRIDLLPRERESGGGALIQAGDKATVLGGSEKTQP